MIEIHEGTGGYYLHDPHNHLRFGADDCYRTPEGARTAASTSVVSHRERICDRTPDKVAKPLVTRQAIAAGRP